LMSLLGIDLPALLQRRRARVVAAFRNQDLTHVDILTLGRQFAAAFPDREQPVLAIGLRTAGSYFAPLLCAALAVNGYRDPVAVIVDEPPNTGGTLAKSVDLLRRVGFAAGRVVALLPIHPTRREWAADQEFLSRSGIRAVFLEPEHYYKYQLLDPQSVETLMAEYFQWRKYSHVQVLASPSAERMNRSLHERSDEKFHTRLKRVFEIHLADPHGRADTRY